MKTCFIVLLGLMTGIPVFAHELWTPEQIAGRTLVLVGDDYVESYSFAPNGVVLATVGRQGGPVAGPAFRWVVKDGVLEIRDGVVVKQRFVLERFTTSEVVVARESGALATFAIRPTN